jgi:hypothetical protein
MPASEHSDRLDLERLERYLPELLHQYVPDPTPLAALPHGARGEPAHLPLA